MAGNSAVLGLIWPKFVLIQAFMVVLVTFKNEEELIKNERGRVLTTFLPLTLWDFYMTLQPLIESSRN